MSDTKALKLILIEPLPGNYTDIANRLLVYRDQAAAELEELKAEWDKSTEEFDNLHHELSGVKSDNRGLHKQIAQLRAQLAAQQAVIDEARKAIEYYAHDGSVISGTYVAQKWLSANPKDGVK